VTIHKKALPEEKRGGGAHLPEKAFISGVEGGDPWQGRKVYSPKHWVGAEKKSRGEKRFCV